MKYLKLILAGLFWTINTLGILYLYEKFIDKPDSQVNNDIGKIKNKSKKGGASDVEVSMPTDIQEVPKKRKFERVRKIFKRNK